MYKHLVEILEDHTETNGYNQQLRQSMRHIAYIYCQRTEAGGRENLYASRIVHENQCVYTTRMRSGIAAGMFLREGGKMYRIEATQNESDRWLHLTVTLTGAIDNYPLPAEDSSDDSSDGSDGV